MPRTVPLIRAGAMAPFLAWMRAHGRPVAGLLQEAGLSGFDVDDTNRPVPLLSVFRFVCLACRIEGPDLPARVVTGSSLSELGVIGRVARSRATVRDALTAAMTIHPYHTTHEIISIRGVRGGVALREAWGMRLDDESRHVAQQYVAALIQSLCDPDGKHRPVFAQMALAAHPVHGIAHLRAHFGDIVASSRDGTLELLIPDSVADRPCNISGQGAPVDRARSYVPLPHGKEGLVPSARMVVAGLLANGTPTIAQLATAAGQSVRTLQRRLAEEGMTFSQLVEDVRHERAMAGIAAGDTSAGEIAARLGYRQPSSLTRAVRRWEGSTPRSMRQMASRPGKAT